MLKLNIIKEMKEDDREYKLYGIGDYTVDVSCRKGQIYSIHVSANYESRRENYLPEIYFTDGSFGSDIKGFKIQTTSYGALDSDEIQKVIAGYNTAMEVVSVLTKEFL